MTTSLKPRRPSWMTSLGSEGMGDAFFDRLWPEWQRDLGEEYDAEALSPQIDLYEKEGNIILTAELPGIKKEDISLSVENGYVTVSGKKSSEREDEGADFYVKEMRYGSFFRRFRLPEEVKEDAIEATYKDGVLTVSMPLKREPESKKVTVH